MKRWVSNSFLVTILVLGISPMTRRVFITPYLITFLMIFGWWIVIKNKKRNIWLFLGLLVLINLYLNRLLSVNFNPFKINFDTEQSFINYPGIRNSILRYKEEGLWLVYPLRNLFYRNYLIILPWLTNFFKLLSPVFWIKLIGFSGFSLFLLGLCSYFNNKKRNNFVIIWFMLVIATSSLRVLGDTVIYGYLTLPMVFILIFKGTKNKIFYDYFYLWLLLFTLDVVLL